MQQLQRPFGLPGAGDFLIAGSKAISLHAVVSIIVVFRPPTNVETPYTFLEIVVLRDFVVDSNRMKYEESNRMRFVGLQNKKQNNIFDY